MLNSFCRAELRPQGYTYDVAPVFPPGSKLGVAHATSAAHPVPTEHASIADRPQHLSVARPVLTGQLPDTTHPVATDHASITGHSQHLSVARPVLTGQHPDTAHAAPVAQLVGSVHEATAAHVSSVEPHGALVPVLGPAPEKRGSIVRTLAHDAHQPLHVSGGALEGHEGEEAVWEGQSEAGASTHRSAAPGATHWASAAFGTCIM